MVQLAFQFMLELEHTEAWDKLEVRTILRFKFLKASRSPASLDQRWIRLRLSPR